MKRNLLLFALAFSVAALMPSASALPITLTYTGTGSGSLGGTAFVDADFTFVGIGDTDARYVQFNAYHIDHATTTFTIAGLGTFNGTAPMKTFFNFNNDTVGMSRHLAGDVYNGFMPALSGWDMTTSVGPILADMELLQWGGAGVTTEGGQLLFDDGFVNGSFTATVGSRTPSVPDHASTLALLGCTLTVLATFRRCSRS